MVQPGRQRETDLADDLHPHVHGRECVGPGVRRRQFGPWRVGIVHWLAPSFHGTIIGELRAARASRPAPSASRPRAADAVPTLHPIPAAVSRPRAAAVAVPPRILLWERLQPPASTPNGKALCRGRLWQYLYVP